MNSIFAKEAPEIIAILEKATFPLAEINSSLAYMTDKQVDATAAAKIFLQTKADIWGSWVSADAKARIEAAVK